MKTKGLWLVALFLLCALVWTTYAQKQADTKPTWEYMSMTVPDHASGIHLNRAGEQGWELVAVTQPEGANTAKSYFFKRAK
jgi:hypothetical protein